MENRGNLPGPLIQVPRLLIALAVPRAIPGQPWGGGSRIILECASWVLLWGRSCGESASPRGGTATCLGFRGWGSRPGSAGMAVTLACWSIPEASTRRSSYAKPVGRSRPAWELVFPRAASLGMDTSKEWKLSIRRVNISQ